MLCGAKFQVKCSFTVPSLETSTLVGPTGFQKYVSPSLIVALAGQEGGDIASLAFPFFHLKMKPVLNKILLKPIKAPVPIIFPWLPFSEKKF